MHRLRPLTEEECYLRCYGWIGSSEDVTVLETEPSLDAGSPSILAERIRLRLEAALQEQDREAA